MTMTTQISTLALSNYGFSLKGTAPALAPLAISQQLFAVTDGSHMVFPLTSGSSAQLLAATVTGVFATDWQGTMMPMYPYYRTNYQQYTNNPTLAWPTYNPTYIDITMNVADPSGGTGAYQIGCHTQVASMQNIITAPAGNVLYTNSMWIQRVGVNTTFGVIGPNGQSVNFTYSDTNWHRVSVTTLPYNGTNVYQGVYPTGTGRPFNVFAPQTEIGSVANRFLPNTSGPYGRTDFDYAQIGTSISGVDQYPSAGVSLYWSGTGYIAGTASGSQLYSPASPWDLGVDAFNNMATNTQGMAVAQDVASAIQLFNGELYFDTTQGVPYFSQVFVPPFNSVLVSSLLTQAAYTVPNVVQAQAQGVTMSPITRRVTGTINVVDVNGQALGVRL